MADEEKIVLTLEANDEASKKIEAIAKALRNLDKDASNSGNGSSKSISNMISSFESGVNRINSATRQYNATMRGFNRTMINIVKDAGAAIYDFTSDSIKNFTDFSEQHAKVLGAMAADYDKTAESQAKFFADSQKLKEQAMQIGTYGISGTGALIDITGISQAQESLVKAGVSPDDIINTNALKDVLTFAQGNQLDIDSAVSTAVTLGNQFNIPMNEWGLMLDKISHTADMSIVEVSDIVQSLKWASGISSGLGRGGMKDMDKLNETLAMLTILGDFGLKGSQAGTGIQAMLTRMLTGDTTVITAAQKEVAPGNALEKFYEFEKKAKPNGNLLPMADVIEELNSTMSDMTDEEQAWFSKKLFGLYQMKAAYALLNGEETDLNKVIEEIETLSEGTNQSKLDKLLESQYGQLTSLNNLWEGVKTDVGDRLNPFVKAIRDELFSFLKSDGHYNINFDKLESALNESCDLIEEKYGVAIADAARGIGGIALDLTQIVAQVGPEFGKGIVELINDATNGGGLSGKNGVFTNWREMIDNMYKSVDGLPEDMQNLGDAIVTVIDWCGKLVTINIASEIAELISSVLQILTIAGGAIINVAGAVVVNGDGTLTGKNKGTNTLPTVGPTGKVLKGGKSVVGSADDIAKASGMSVDDVKNLLGNKSKYTVKDIAEATGNSVDDVIKAWGSQVDDISKIGGLWGKLSKVGKGMAIVGTAVQVGSTGLEAYGDFKKGDTKGGVEAISGGGGALAGGWAGAKGGAALGSMILPGWGTAIGAIAGGILGSLGGDWLGRKASGAIYDATTMTTSTNLGETTLNSENVTITGTGQINVPNNNSNNKQILTFPNKTNYFDIPTSIPSSSEPANVGSTTLNSDNVTITGQVNIPNIGDTFNNIFQNKGAPFADKNGQMLQNNINIDDRITMQPQFNVTPPNVNVNVNVDQSGRITKNTQILNPWQTQLFNNWFSRTSSQYGSTTK
jgi:TP901 family phage tail tape measure protein